MSHEIPSEIFNWGSFRKAFEEMGGSIADGLEARRARSSYKILKGRISPFEDEDLAITLTFDQENFPGRSFVTHVLHFPGRVVVLNECLNPEGLRGVILRIEKCEVKESDPHTLRGKYRIWIGDRLVRFQ